MAGTTATATAITSSALKTISTTELLEAILLKFDMKTLLLCQRVSKHFRGTVQGSKVLRQALFLESIVAASPMHIDPLSKDLRYFKHRRALPVSKIFNTFDAGRDGQPSLIASAPHAADVANGGVLRSTINPLLLDSRIGIDMSGSSVHIGYSFNAEHLSFAFSLTKLRTQDDQDLKDMSLPVPRCSMTDMLLVQPAQEAYMCIWNAPSYESINFRKLPSGQTVGQMIQEVNREIDAWLRSMG